MQAHFPRAYIDINREPYELDPVLFNGRLPDFVNSQSLRAIGGLGTIARIVNEKEEIYHGPLTLETAFVRIERLYKPYHAALHRTHAIDPRAVWDGVPARLPFDAVPAGRPWRAGRISFSATAWHVLRSGDHETRSGALAEPWLSCRPEQAHAGGYITEHYGKPHQGVHALQIEVDRSLYMDEETFEKSSAFSGLLWDMERLVAALVQELPRWTGGSKVAAE